MLFLRLRLQQLKSEIIRGWYEVPYLYFTLGVFAVSVVGISYKISVMDNKDHHYNRHKINYLIVRPNDARLKRYPRKYITDVDVLENYEKQQNKQD